MRFVHLIQSYFNPLPRKEGDVVGFTSIKLSFSISIHSLVKRETIRTGDFEIPEPNFNPLPRKEGDSKYS